MDLLIAILLVLFAWWAFESLTAVILVAVAVAVVLWIMRNGNFPR